MEHRNLRDRLQFEGKARLLAFLDGGSLLLRILESLLYDFDFVVLGRQIGDPKLAALGFAGIRLAVDQDGGIVLARVDYQHAAAAAGVNPGREHGSGTSRYCKLAVVFPVVEGQFMVARGDIFQVDAVSSRVSLRLTVERHLHRHNAGANMDLAAKTAGQDGGEIFGRDGTLKRGRRSGSGYKRELRLTAFIAGDFDVVCTGSQMIENGLSILQRSHKLAIQNHLAA